MRQVWSANDAIVDCKQERLTEVSLFCRDILVYATFVLVAEARFELTTFGL